MTVRSVARMVVVGLVAAGSADVAMAQEPLRPFVGLWRLVSWPQRLADGTSRQGANSVAYFVYTDTGHMCYVAMDPGRSMWASETNPTAEEAIAGIAGVGAYCARVDVHAREGFLLHRVEIEKVPNIVGRTRKRWFTFDGPDRLTLRVDPAEVVPPVVESTLVLERVRK